MAVKDPENLLQTGKKHLFRRYRHEFEFRFMLNSLLNDHRTVYWLEMDPGQPEFNVSGWLSLVKVTKPRMGPNYPFLKNEENHFEIISQYYLGEFGLQQAARLYIHIIEQ